MHVIQHLRIEATADDQPSARRLQDDLGRWCRSEVFWQRVSDKLDELMPADRILQVEKVEINVDASDEKSFLEAVLEQLMGEVVQCIGKQTVSRYEYTQRQALYFLVYGYMPPHAADADSASVRLFLKNLADTVDPSFAEMLATRLHDAALVVERLIWHLGAVRGRKALLLLLLEMQRRTAPRVEIEQVIKSYLCDMDRAGNPTSLEIRFWQFLFQPNVSGTFTTKAELTHAWNRFATGREGLERIKQPAGNDFHVDHQAIFYIKNAGFVLLAPFLPQLFKALEWTAHQSWADEEKAHLAVRLIGHICSGTDDDWEYNWVLAKILCGLEPDTVISQEPPLDQSAIDLSVQMVKAAIGQWAVLKSMSVEGLREMFLLRDGKLSRDDEGTGWRLQVDKKAQDVLLERIPWGFSVIRLPWMKDMLFVEW